MLSSREHGMAEALFMIDPSTGMPINYELEVVKPLIGRILMAQEIQKRFYPEIILILVLQMMRFYRLLRDLRKECDD